MNKKDDLKNQIKHCDMFDFMDKYVGRKDLHPGGIKATINLLNELPFSKSQRVLDVACGKGRTAVYIAKKYGCHVTGIDISKESIKDAILYAKKRNVENLTDFQCENVMSLPYENNYFDNIYSQAVLVLVDDIQIALREVYRILKKNGYCAWSELAWINEPTDEFLESIRTELYAECIARVKSYNGWENEFRKTGLKDLRIKQYSMESQNMFDMLLEEGFFDSLKILYRFMTNSDIRKRMKVLHNFFKKHMRRQ